MTTRTRHKPHRPAEVARALSDLHKLFMPTPRQLAEQRMRDAKEAMSTAARAVIFGSPNAERLSNEALSELREAQTELARLDAEQS